MITTAELSKWISSDRQHGVNINSGVLNDIVSEVITLRADLVQAKDAEIARLRERVAALTADNEALQRTVADGRRNFDSADWYWRTMDPDDCGDTPHEAISRAMVGQFCVCEIASSFSGPTRYGFIAPALDPESDDEEFVHFATQQEALEAAKARAALTPPGDPAAKIGGDA